MTHTAKATAGNISSKCTALALLKVGHLSTCINPNVFSDNYCTV